MSGALAEDRHVMLVRSLHGIPGTVVSIYTRPSLSGVLELCQIRFKLGVLSDE